MNPQDTRGLVELLLVFGIVVAWAVWQLISVKREGRRARDEDRER